MQIMKKAIRIVVGRSKGRESGGIDARHFFDRMAGIPGRIHRRCAASSEFMATSLKLSRYPVLLVDDSGADCLLMRLALGAQARLELVHEAHDGREAIAYLNGDEPFCDRGRHPFPRLLVLDLKMPCRSGHDVLSWLKGRDCEGLKVVIMTGSGLEEDRERAMALGAAAYHVKPTDRGEREAMVSSFVALLEEESERKLQ